jgi:WD40 repeat protein
MIRPWDVDNRREILGHFKDPTGGNGWLAVSPDGTRLFSVGGNVLRCWNLDTGKVIQTLKWEEPPVGGCFTPDGRQVVWGGWGGNLRMYRLTDIPVVQTLARPVNERLRREAEVHHQEPEGGVSTQGVEVVVRECAKNATSVAIGES